MAKKKSTTRKPAKKKQKPNDFRKFVKWFWLALFAAPIFFALILFITWLGAFGPIPSIDEIADPKTKLASQIISYDGELIGKYYRENRINTEYRDLFSALDQCPGKYRG